MHAQSSQVKHSWLTDHTKKNLATSKSENQNQVICRLKAVLIWNISGPHFPAFGLKTENYSVNLLIQFR